MAKITPIDIIKGVSRKIGGGNSKEYFATNKCSYHIHLAKRVNSSVQPPFNLRSSSVHPPFNLRSSSVQAPFGLRSFSVHLPFILRSVLDRSSFVLRSFSVHSPFVLRSFSVHSPFVLRSFSVRRSKNDRRNIGESSEARRRCIETLKGNQGKGNLNKKTPKIPHKPHAPDIQKKTLKKLSTRKTLKINTLSKIAKKIFKKTSQNIWSLLKNAVPLHSQIRNNAYHANKIAKCKCLKMSCEIDL